MPWRHWITVVKQRGKTRLVCVCGEASGWLTDQTEIDLWQVKHTGLREKDRRLK